MGVCYLSVGLNLQAALPGRSSALAQSCEKQQRTWGSFLGIVATPSSIQRLHQPPLHTSVRTSVSGQYVTLLPQTAPSLSLKAFHNETRENRQCPEQNNREAASPDKGRTSGQPAATSKLVLKLLLLSYDILSCCQISKGLCPGVFLLTTARLDSTILFKTSLAWKGSTLGSFSLSPFHVPRIYLA